MVLRRAAELDHDLALRPSEGLDAAALEEAAVEAGLSRTSVRRALAELRVGALEAAGGRPGRAPRLLGPGTLVVRRSVPAGPEAAEARVREFLGRQLFRVCRDVGGRSRWTPREDLRASVQRSVDSHLQRRLVLGDVGEVQLAVAAERGPDGEPGAGGGAGPGPARSMVHLQLDVRDARRSHGAWVASGALLGAAALAGSVAAGAPEAVTLLAVPAGAGAAVAGHRVGSRRYRQRMRALETAVQGLLDGLDRRPADHRRSPTP